MSRRRPTAYLFLEGIKVVNDDTNKQVEGKERSTDDENDEIEVVVERSLPIRLFVNFSRVNCIGHHFHPSLKCCLEKYAGEKCDI